MAFVGVRLTDCVRYGFRIGPRWKNEVVDLVNGGEVINRMWLYPRYEANADFAMLPATAQTELLSVFNAMVGNLHKFRVKDWTDYTAANEPLSPVIGTSTPVQLFKTYVRAGQATQRRIQAPVTAVVKGDGTPVAGTLDAGYGLFTPSSPWASAVYTWDGEFDIWMRLISDYNALTFARPNTVEAQIDLIEVKRNLPA